MISPHKYDQRTKLVHSKYPDLLWTNFVRLASPKPRTSKFVVWKWFKRRRPALDANDDDTQ